MNFYSANTIVHTGQNGFEKAGGIVKHSSAYKDITDEELKGKQVIVINGSKSATDIAVHVANRGARQVTMFYTVRLCVAYPLPDHQFQAYTLYESTGNTVCIMERKTDIDLIYKLVAIVS
jgi:NADPH-dependent glutamate synthase beta subunit-like oxidoreductase